MGALVAPRSNKAFGVLVGRLSLVTLVLLAAFCVAAATGARYGLLFLIGLGLGATLEGLRFGFAGPWRAMVVNRDPAGLLAQLLSIALVALVAIPLIDANGSELTGAHAPVGYAMVGGAFVFGLAMQIVLGCGSGTLVNAGSGNPIGLVALPFFAAGSFVGASHLNWWTALGTLPVVAGHGFSGVALTLAGLAVTACVLLTFAAPAKRKLPRRLCLAAVIVSVLALGNLVVSGQPWGVVYGLGLWAAKSAQAVGFDLTASAFWGAPVNQEKLRQTLLTDTTSLTNLGLIGGAFVVSMWRGGYAQGLPKRPPRAWLSVIVAGFLLGYTSRLAFGCNVGAFFSGISTGSLHGWVWFVSAFAGSWLGIRLRPLLALEERG